jgi:hypothetical protein
MPAWPNNERSANMIDSLEELIDWIENEVATAPSRREAWMGIAEMAERQARMVRDAEVDSWLWLADEARQRAGKSGPGSG